MPQWNLTTLPNLPIGSNYASLKEFAKYSNGFAIHGGLGYQIPTGNIYPFENVWYSKDGIQPWTGVGGLPFAKNHTWIKKGGKNYMVGGYIGSPSVGFSLTDRVIEITGYPGKSYQILNPLPKVVAYHTMVVKGGKAWLQGGLDAVNASDEAYETSNFSSWVGHSQAMPKKLYGHAVAKSGGSVYVSGGIDENGIYNSKIWKVVDFTNGATWTEVFDFAGMTGQAGQWANGFAFHDMHIGGKYMHLFHGKASLNDTISGVGTIYIPTWTFVPLSFGQSGTSGERNVFQKSQKEFIVIGSKSAIDKAVRLLEYLP